MSHDLNEHDAQFDEVVGGYRSCPKSLESIKVRVGKAVSPIQGAVMTWHDKASQVMWNSEGITVGAVHM